jgi:membrane protein implicated in regulation of membrane protease activity
MIDVTVVTFSQFTRRDSNPYDHHVPAWLVWSLIAVALLIGEIATPGLFFLGPLALAALPAAIAAALGGGWVVELALFVAGAVLSLAFLRPIARRHLQLPSSVRTGAAALVGARALVLERVDAVGGRVKIGGEVWSARAFDEAQVLEPGTHVHVAEIQGATALVYL